ncbi:hypothetical protein EIP86_007253 [Pleurotus ostreatoroseus]|nr:hypothetical protein EIP86_007253 [Pleurotus ostreatoroseus]
MTRSPEKATELAADEIEPVVGTPTDLNPLSSLFSTLDAVIDASSGPDIRTSSAALLASFSEIVRTHRPAHAPKLTFICTSGTWVHGTSRTQPVSDTTPLSAPATLVVWRPAQEQAVLTSTDLAGIVIRPALVYGRGASLFAPLFKGASEGAVRWFGSSEDRYALIHCDDLAELYVLAAERATLVRGLAFDAANDMTEGADELLRRLVRVSGARGPHEFIEPSNTYEEALTTTTLLRPYLARSLLGWSPRKAGLVDGLETYYNAWKASAGL